MKKKYPIIDEHRKHYVRMPIQITESTLPVDSEISKYLKIGDWVAVNVFPKTELFEGGYQHLISPISFSDEEICQKSCDIHNEYFGWTPKEVKEIISQSMSLK